MSALNHAHDRRNALLCALVVAACVLLTRPFVQMGVIDDWSYIKTAQMFARTGSFVYNNWATAILGWQVPLGALGIKLFGFSFTAARAYMLPTTALGAWLFYRILANFGVNAFNATFGTLALFLSPLLMPLEFIVMTDIPGIVAVLLCIFLCQKAVLATTPSATIVWLCVAAATNLFAGTPRQIAWLGALVIVPCTAFLLRKRRGVLLSGFVLVAGSVVGILLILHWFNGHPNVVPEKLIQRKLSLHWFGHLATQLIRLFLALLFLLLPLTLAWLAAVGRRGRAAWIRLATVVVLAAAVFLTLPHIGTTDRPTTWLMPFANDVMDSIGMAPPPLAQMLGQPVILGMNLRVFLSTLIILAGYCCLDQLVSFLWARRKAGLYAGALAPLPLDAPSHSANPLGPLDSWRSVLWMLGPFVAVYIVFLVPRGLAAMLFDRYLMELFAVALILLLRFYQQYFAPRLPAVSVVALAIFSLYSIAGVHDLFSLYRARVALGDEVMAAGVPRTAIQGGFEFDGWTQVMDGGNILNDPHIGIRVEKMPTECSNWFTASTPSVNPRYFLMRSAVPCFDSAPFPEVGYTTWLPPFHRSLRVGVLNQQYSKVPYILTNQPGARDDLP